MVGGMNIPPANAKFDNGTKVTPIWSSVTFPPGVVVATIFPVAGALCNHVVVDHGKNTIDVKDIDGGVSLMVWSENALTT